MRFPTVTFRALHADEKPFMKPNSRTTSEERGRVVVQKNQASLQVQADLKFALDASNVGGFSYLSLARNEREHRPRTYSGPIIFELWQ